MENHLRENDVNLDLETNDAWFCLTCANKPQSHLHDKKPEWRNNCRRSTVRHIRVSTSIRVATKQRDARGRNAHEWRERQENYTQLWQASSYYLQPRNTAAYRTQYNKTRHRSHRLYKQNFNQTSTVVTELKYFDCKKLTISKCRCRSTLTRRQCCYSDRWTDSGLS